MSSLKCFIRNRTDGNDVCVSGALTFISAFFCLEASDDLERKGGYLEPQGQPFINSCFNWMMNQNLYIENGGKSPHISIHLSMVVWGSR